MTEFESSFSYHWKKDKLTITSVRATARMGVRRYNMMTKANGSNATETDEALIPLRLIVYPDCYVCSTVTKNGEPWDIPFEEFVELPEDLIDLWYEQACRVNPHWTAVSEGSASEVKK